MKFQPKTEKEIAEMNLLPEGVYPFEVLNAVNKTSKAGNEMIEIDLLVHTPAGGRIPMTDWLMEKMAKKLRNFCHRHNLGAKYDAGHLTAEDCLGVNGYLYLTIQKGGPKPDGSGSWPDKNSVANYCLQPQPKPAPTHTPPANATQSGPVGAVHGDDDTDDVPF